MHILIPAVSRFTQLTGICRHAVNHAQAVADLPDVSQVTLLVGAWQERYFRETLSDPSRKTALAVARCKNNSISRNLWYSRELPSLSSELKVALVHLAYPAPIRRSRFSAPVVGTVHDLYPMDHPKNFGFPNVFFNRMFLKRCVHESDALTCVSEYTSERLLHHFPSVGDHKLVTTISSYSTLAHLPAVRPAEFQGERFILTVGQHRHNKNIGLIIRAYAALLSSDLIAPLQLVIAGAAGPQTGVLKTLVKQLALDRRVIFLEKLTDANLAWLYRNCEVFIVASSIEGFCLPLIEAHELSPRIVCSDIPVFREVVGRDCDFFSLNGAAADSLTNAVSRVLRSPRQTRSRDSRFSRSAATRAYARLYSKLLTVSDRAPSVSAVS